MSVLIKDITFDKKEVDFGEFVATIGEKYNQIEDMIFAGIISSSDSEDITTKSDFDNYVNKRLGK